MSLMSPFQELDLMSFMGPFQLWIFYDSPKPTGSSPSA